MQVNHRTGRLAPANETEGRRTTRPKERGASLVEYALALALIAVVCIGAVAYLGSGSSSGLNKAGTGIAGTGSNDGGFAAYQAETNACRAAGGYVTTDHTGSPTGNTYLLTCSGGSAPGTFNFDLDKP